jgi:hypothetical protein
MRVNPDLGILAGTDTLLDNPAGGEDIAGSAYDRNRSGLGATTLYGIDFIAGQLVMQGGLNSTPSPNSGVITPIGPLGLTPGSALIGFDIGSDGVAYASMQPSGGLFGLYQINLATGAATLVGAIGNGAVPIAGLAVVLPRFVYLPLIIN